MPQNTNHADYWFTSIRATMNSLLGNNREDLLPREFCANEKQWNSERMAAKLSAGASRNTRRNAGWTNTVSKYSMLLWHFALLTIVTLFCYKCFGDRCHTTVIWDFVVCGTKRWMIRIMMGREYATTFVRCWTVCHMHTSCEHSSNQPEQVHPPTQAHCDWLSRYCRYTSGVFKSKLITACYVEALRQKKCDHFVSYQIDNLKVILLNQVMILRNLQSNHVDEEYAPLITKQLEESTVKLGETASFHCELDAHPVSAIYWRGPAFTNPRKTGEIDRVKTEVQYWFIDTEV